MMTAMFIIQQLNSIAQSGTFLSSPAPESADNSQFTQGGSKVRLLVNQLSWEGPVQNYITLTGISEQPDLRKEIIKQGLNWVDFIIMDVYTHFQHTFMFKQLEKWVPKYPAFCFFSQIAPWL